MDEAELARRIKKERKRKQKAEEGCSSVAYRAHGRLDMSTLMWTSVGVGEISTLSISSFNSEPSMLPPQCLRNTSEVNEKAIQIQWRSYSVNLVPLAMFDVCCSRKTSAKPASAKPQLRASRLFFAPRF